MALHICLVTVIKSCWEMRWNNYFVQCEESDKYAMQERLLPLKESLQITKIEGLGDWDPL